MSEVVDSTEQNTLANRVSQWLHHLSSGVKPSTIDRYRQAMDGFQIFVGREFVTRATWIRYQRHLLAKKMMPGTLHKECAIVAQFFAWCELHEFVKVNPCKFGMRLPPIVVKRLPTFTYEEYERMKAAASKTYGYWMVVASYATGASLCDICQLKWEMVDMNNLVINFVRQKTARYQTLATIPFLPDSDIYVCLTQLATDLTETGPRSQYVCPPLAERYLESHTTAAHIMKRIIKRAGINDKSHKSFRWTLISNWANSGQSTSMGCKIVGTKSPAIFTRYVNPEVESLRSALKTSLDRARERCGPLKEAMLPC
jgi:integrase